MSLSLYDVSVPAFTDGMTGLSWVLAKAQAHYKAQGLDTADLMADRLAPDMLPLSVQVALAVAHSIGAAGRLSGRDSPFSPPPADFAAARKAVADAVAGLKALTPDAFAGAETREIVWDPMGNGGMRFEGGKPYLLGFALPNFYFHITTAYALCRKNGVPLGKRDFMARGEAPEGL